MGAGREGHERRVMVAGLAVRGADFTRPSHFFPASPPPPFVQRMGFLCKAETALTTIAREAYLEGGFTNWKEDRNDQRQHRRRGQEATESH